MQDRVVHHGHLGSAGIDQCQDGHRLLLHVKQGWLGLVWLPQVDQVCLCQVDLPAGQGHQ